MKYRCPICKSMNVYHDVSIQAKQKLNGNNKAVFDIEKGNIDGDYWELAACSKCRYSGNIEEFASKPYGVR